MRIATLTDVGKTRKINQDAYIAGELPGGVGFAVVCDGMGGASGGDTASNTAVKTINDKINSYFRPDMGSNSIRVMLRSALCAANIQIFDLARSVESLSGMGTTVVACYLSDGIAHIAHAGDSRIYLINANNISQLTRDHSIVQSMIESGQLTVEEARFHPRKNVITRALGADETIDIDYTEAATGKDGILLLCTDGLTNHIDPEEMLEIIRKNEFSKCPEKLIKLANEKGGSDNITVVMISAAD